MAIELTGAAVPVLSDFGLDELKIGDRGLPVKLVQEWLTLHGIGVVIDGVYGMATQRALGLYFKNFNATKSGQGVVNDQRWQALWSPMIRTLQPFKSTHQLYYDILECAGRHLQYGSHEIGQNQGPWVRLYMDANPVNGHDGPAFSWCSAFVRFCIRQALFNDHLSWSPDILWGEQDGWSCDRVAEWADAHHMLYTEPNPDVVQPGTVFLIYRGGRDWVHTGFVDNYDYASGVVVTIEGNTNVAGAREGTSVIRRVRSVQNMHFITGYGPPPISLRTVGR